MGLMCWLLYGILGFLFFVGLMFIQRKYTITRIEKLVFSIVFLMIASGICYRFAIKYTENIFLSFVFLMIVDVIYNSYFIESDFFDKSKRNVPYYLVLIFAGFFVNQEFINRVSQVFLTGEDLRVRPPEKRAHALLEPGAHRQLPVEERPLDRRDLPRRAG